jgi:hypothetical protein
MQSMERESIAWTKEPPRRHAGLLAAALANGRRPLALLSALLLGLAALDLWWLAEFRRGFPLDIDESGYLQLSFFMHDSLRTQGPHAFWAAFQHEGWGPPLLPATTAILGFVWGGGRIVASLAGQLVFFVVLVGSVFGIGRRLARSATAGLVAAATIATAPAVTDFTRTYHMAVPSTAMYTLSLYLLLRTDRMRHRLPALAWGVATGLTLLARTMMLAFVPALVIGAVWMVILERFDRRRTVNLVIGLGAAVATSAVWYATSLRPILSYLTSAGYGSASAQYGPAVARSSVHYWSRELEVLINSALYLPLGLALALALVASIPGALQRLRNAGAKRAVLRRFARSDVAIVIFVALEMYLALTSTRNQGTGFIVPLVPLVVVLAVVALFRFVRADARHVVVALTLVVSIVNVGMKADVVSALSRPKTTSLPLLGSVQVLNGEGYLQQNLAANAGYQLGAPTHWLSDRDKRWQSMYDALSTRVHELGPPEPALRLAPDEPLLNASAFRLATYRRYHDGGNIGYVTVAADTVAAYRYFLLDEKPGAVLTVDASRHQYGAPVSGALVSAALRSTRYERSSSLRTPDGRTLTLWVLPASGG